ncbi:MAG: 2,3-bisphosphoglycerate-independent phosphoglycerate mutase [Chloroflexota bacterium]|nr:2,3-bisphosphoglycerate-independent phosphoglycerate mutase [Anaerolineales bacterium]MCB8969081.1 2,3-bisphosphoglycerate-independent phosphoglycerate mutase [Ardenticatenaceae bacterium]MCB8989037.1 2,3-bisphosphoglycerate-independent phosphoglycerate mutase [Ardenticatenaceae bacterium]
MKAYKPVALIILDGWGIRENAAGNAVVLGNTPNYDKWNRELERSVLDASGEAVGLPEGQMGNSEVGHLNLGAGRVVYQDLTRINLAIRNGTFNQTPALVEAVASAKEKKGNVHVIGLFGPGGVHSHSDHMFAILDLVNEQGLTPVLHIITDGRDTPPQSSLTFLEPLEAYQKEKAVAVASVSGRYYTMDRDKRWPRTQIGYDVIASHQGFEGRTAETARAAIEASHADGVTDEFVKPVAIDCGDKDVTIRPGDSVIFYNFRADRMRQPVTIFTDRAFAGFDREFIEDLFIVTMTNYDDAYPVHVAFPEQAITNTLAEVLCKHGLQQFHAAETEKYAHVTYFFNGGVETMYEGEARHLEPSPKVPTYDLQPEMSARPLTDAVVQRIAEHDDDFILVNFANPDMVGHTGVLEAAIKAVEAVDECAGRLVEAIVAKGGIACVTADHGNCDRMIDLYTGNPHTYHTTQPVAFFVIGYDGYLNMRPRGALADVSPTVLELMGVPQPPEMTGKSLLEHSGK